MTDASRVAFVTLGCKVNQTESEDIARDLGTAPGALAPEDAEVVVINTCTVTAEADHKARKAVRHALGLPGRPLVVVTGCLAALHADALAALGDRVVVEPDKLKVAARVAAAGHPSSTTPATAPAPASVRAHARVQLKVEDGCDAFCTYCIVPYARGVPRAVPLAGMVTRAEELAASGVGEVVLTGINIGRYNDRGATLADVLEAVAATGVPRVRLSSIEPRDVNDRLLAAARSTGAFCAHLHIPLQSGSDTVLRRMGRPYTTAEFAERVAAARDALPGMAVTTDVIAGFPGESDAEAAETLAFVEEVGFSRLHIFRYSRREGTPASAMPGQVDARVKAERAATLRSAGERSARAFAHSFVGRDVEVLVERTATGPGGSVMAEGTTREYLRAVFEPVPGAHVRAGARVRVAVSAVDVSGRLQG